MTLAQGLAREYQTMAVTNTLACYGTELITTVKGFMIRAPRLKPIINRAKKS
jgi:hypothetical protein